MASSSSSKHKKSYDVYLSFRGPDVLDNFPGHLYTALAQNGPFTYISSDELDKGEQIWPALMKAIEESRVAIIIFSKDYASSAWCLEEVAKIMACMEHRDLMVFPVFYKVEPRDVRGQRQSYGNAMARHELKFGKERVNRWKKALFDAGCLSGLHLTDGEEEGTLQMHDLLQLMGKDIVEEEYREDPRKRSRLWHYEDVLEVISGDVGMDAIKAIVLELPKSKETYIGPNAFINMRNLRLLILLNLDNSFQGPIHLPNELRWFEWPNCAWIPDFSKGPKKLVGLDTRKSRMKVVGEQFEDFEKLKFINFSECQSLVCMPDLNCTPNLEELDLHGCKNLEHAHESVAYHDRLRWLNLSGCSKLCHLPNVLQSKNLELLNLNHCSKLQSFPDIPNKIEGLRGLYLIGTSIKKLPASIENLVSLEEMDLRYCKKLVILPSSIYRLLNLERLTLEGCSKLVKFPKHEDLSDSRMKTGFPKLYVLNLRGCNLSEGDFLENHSCFPSLRALYLLGNNFTNLPTCRQLNNLLCLDVSYCQQLQEIPHNPGQLSHLWSIGCESLSKFPPDKCDVEGYPVAKGRPVREPRLPSWPRSWLVLAVFATIAIIFGVAKGVR